MGDELSVKFEGTLILKCYSALMRQIGKQKHYVKLQCFLVTDGGF